MMDYKLLYACIPNHQKWGFPFSG